MDKNMNDDFRRLFSGFWSQFKSDPIGAPAGLLYFYLLERISCNGWKPICLTDIEISRALKISRNDMSKYRQALKSRNLIEFAKDMSVHNGGIIYSFPNQRALFSASPCLKPCTEKNVANKIAKPEVAEDLTEKLVAEMGKSPVWRQAICKNHRLTESQLTEFLERFANFCISEGRSHTSLKDAKANFNRWLTWRMRIDQDEEAHAQTRPQSRDEHRRELIQASFEGLQKAINGQIRDERQENPF